MTDALQEKIGEVLHENHSYEVRFGTIHMSDSISKIGYCLINKSTGVEEYQTFSLPSILDIAENWDNKLQRKFHEMYSYRTDEPAPEQLALLPEAPEASH